MKIKIIKSGPWLIGGNRVNFVEGQSLEVGVDVPDAIAEDMLRCDYAIKAAGRPRIEKKDVKEVEVKKEHTSSKKGDKK